MLQFSLRSRTPSVNGSYCSPYSSLTRKVRRAPRSAGRATGAGAVSSHVAVAGSGRATAHRLAFAERLQNDDDSEHCSRSLAGLYFNKRIVIVGWLSPF